MQDERLAAHAKMRYYPAAPMPIRFTCEVTDPHTENLLRYLEETLGDNEVHKLEVLSCARQWLEMEYKTPTVFTRDGGRESLSLQLVDGSDDPASS